MGGVLLVFLALGACAKQPDVKDPTPAKLDGVATANPVAPGATVAPSASTGLPAAMPAYK